MLRYTTAGESHGPGLTAILEGMPAGLELSREAIDAELRRRQGGYGRGGRMRIETDRAHIVGGVRFGRTMGSPIAVWIPNADHANWREVLSVWGRSPAGKAARRVTRPRPGHADLPGALKYDTHDARDILERASARETTARVAVGAIAKILLARLGVRITSHTASVGSERAAGASSVSFARASRIPAGSPLRCVSRASEARMIRLIDAARRSGDTLGGTFEVIGRGVLPGLGSVVTADRRLDGRIAAAMMTIPAVKAVAIGEGLAAAGLRGSSVHDEIRYTKARGFFRRTNRSGGIEGGMTTGEDVRVTAFLKPLSTLARPLASVDLVTKSRSVAAFERTDTIPIVAAGVIGEAMLALVLADAALEKSGGDSIGEVMRNWEGFRRQVARF